MNKTPGGSVQKKRRQRQRPSSLPVLKREPGALLNSAASRNGAVLFALASLIFSDECGRTISTPTWLNQTLAAALFLWALIILYPRCTFFVKHVWSDGKTARNQLVTAIALIALGVGLSLTVMGLFDPRPNLEGKILNAKVLTADNKVFVLLTATVANTGSPTTLRAFELCATLLNGDTVCGHRETMPDVLPMAAPGVPDQYAYAADSLQEKTVESPIPRGGTVIGRLYFHFDRMTTNDLSLSGVQYRLTFKDAWESSYTAELKYQARSPSPLIKAHPGLNNPQTIPKGKEENSERLSR